MAARAAMEGGREKLHSKTYAGRIDHEMPQLKSHAAQTVNDRREMTQSKTRAARAANEMLRSKTYASRIDNEMLKLKTHVKPRRQIFKSTTHASQAAMKGERGHEIPLSNRAGQKVEGGYGMPKSKIYREMPQSKPHHSAKATTENGHEIRQTKTNVGQAMSDGASLKRPNSYSNAFKSTSGPPTKKHRNF